MYHRIKKTDEMNIIMIHIKDLKPIRKIEYIGIEIKIALFVLIGFLMGLHLGNVSEVFSFNSFRLEEYFGDYTIEQGTEASLFFWYIFFIRLHQFILLFLFPRIFEGGKALGILLLVYGIGMGIYLINMIQTFSINGIVMCFLTIFPQMFFYIPCSYLALILGLECVENKRKYDIMSRESTLEKAFKASRSYFTKRKTACWNGIYACVLWLMGILTESLLNPVFVEWMIR